MPAQEGRNGLAQLLGYNGRMHNDFMTFYVDPAWRREGQHTALLYPFWGNTLDPSRTPLQHALFERHSFDTSVYAITDVLAKADAVLMPYSHNVVRRCFPELLQTCHEVAQRAHIPLLVDAMSDVEVPIDLPNTFVLRWAGYRFLPHEHDIHLPPYADDLLEVFCDGKLSLRAKSERPIVAFSGWASMTLKQEVRSIVKELPARLRGIFDTRYRSMKKGIFFRREAVAILRRSPLVETHFNVRSSYSAHTHTAEKPPKELQQELVDNLLSSDYGLDARGDPNASTRLFEIASLGRIPLIIDTERCLPFSDTLDYSTFSLVVDFRDMHRLPEIVAQFHAGLTDAKFQEMQQNARDAFVRYFRVDALMQNIIRELRKRTLRS